eukprot:COSAG05_NODE_13_length_36464_cov_294.169449_11_plen_43_part_00
MHGKWVELVPMLLYVGGGCSVCTADARLRQASRAANTALASA